MTATKKWICIFSEAGLAALSAFIDRTTLFTFDLDGTLAPIVENPAGIMISGDVREKMIRLCALATVAVLTGRARDDARAHLGFEPRFIVGNHGAEGLPGWEQREGGFVRLGRQWEDQLRAILPHALESGIVIENKGSSLTLHYRKAPDREAAHAEILRAVRRLAPLPRSISGKCVENIMPSDSLNKGEALLQLMRHAGSDRAVFIGDDVTDEDVFRLRNDRVLGIRVGNSSPSEADYCLSDQNQIDR
ncbi:MAG: trehalose-phosphatase, partial [Syntrophales bacterium]|nr:trehalose-phosphatase [Syntrophales bacterium]